MEKRKKDTKNFNLNSQTDINWTKKAEQIK